MDAFLIRYVTDTIFFETSWGTVAGHRWSADHTLTNTALNRTRHDKICWQTQDNKSLYVVKCTDNNRQVQMSVSRRWAVSRSPDVMRDYTCYLRSYTSNQLNWINNKRRCHVFKCKSKVCTSRSLQIFFLVLWGLGSNCGRLRTKWSAASASLAICVSTRTGVSWSGEPGQQGPGLVLVLGPLPGLGVGPAVEPWLL
jgi:hypothetical protein